MLVPLTGTQIFYSNLWRKNLDTKLTKQLGLITLLYYKRMGLKPYSVTAHFLCAALKKCKITFLENFFFMGNLWQNLASFWIFLDHIFKTVLSQFFLMFSVLSSKIKHKKAIENRTPV